MSKTTALPELKTCAACRTAIRRAASMCPTCGYGVPAVPQLLCLECLRISQAARRAANRVSAAVLAVFRPVQRCARCHGTELVPLESELAGRLLAVKRRCLIIAATPAEPAAGHRVEARSGAAAG